MDIFEFELRYKAYQGLNTLCELSWNEEKIIDLVATTNQGVPQKKLQEHSPEELKELTRATYTLKKQHYIEKYTSFSADFSKEKLYRPLNEYIERLEYEMKVIKEMGFNTYMLVVSDFTMRAKNNAIMVGP